MSASVRAVATLSRSQRRPRLRSNLELTSGSRIGAQSGQQEIRHRHRSSKHLVNRRLNHCIDGICDLTTLFAPLLEVTSSPLERRKRSPRRGCASWQIWRTRTYVRALLGAASTSFDFRGTHPTTNGKAATRTDNTPQAPAVTQERPARAGKDAKLTVATSTGSSGRYAMANDSILFVLSRGSMMRSNAMPVATAPVAQPQVKIDFSNQFSPSTLGASRKT